MLVFWDQRLAFLATPKTGSTAIETALESLAAVAVQRPPVLKHTNALRFNRFLRPYLEAAAGAEFTLVALMREPRDWLGSWYRYKLREAIAETDRSTGNMSFDSFVQAYCTDPTPEIANVGAQSRFLAGRDGIGVDRLFRYEDITAFVDFLEERLACEIVLPRANVSPPAATDLSADTEARLRVTAAADFALHASLGPA